MKNKFANLIKSIDFYNRNIELYFNGHNGERTIFGGFVTLFNLIVIILLILGLGQDFLYRLNPAVINQEITPNLYTNFIIKNENFPIAFRVDDLNTNHVDPEEKIFYIKVHYEKYQRRDGNLTPLYIGTIPHKQCSPSDFSNSTQSLFEDNGLINFFCIDYNQIPDSGLLEFGGNWDGEFINYFYINYYACIEGLTNPNTGQKCGSNFQRNNLIANQAFATLLFPLVNFNPGNYTTSLSSRLNAVYTMLDSKITKSIYIMIENIIVESDIGWIMSDIKEENQLSLKSSRLDVKSSLSLDIQESLGEVILSSFYFNMEKTIRNYKRSYTKIQTLAANVGGILKVFNVFIMFLVGFYNQSSLLFQLLSIYQEYKHKNLILLSSNVDSRNININNLSKIEKVNQTELMYINNNNKKILNRDNELITKNDENDKLSVTVFQINQLKQETVYVQRIHNLLMSQDIKINEKDSSFGFAYYLYSVSFKGLLCCKSTIQDKKTSMVKSALDIRKILKFTIKFELLLNTMFSSYEQNKLFKISK